MAAKKPEAEAEAPKKKGKLLIIVSALVVVLGGGGGAAWFFLRPSDANAHVEKPKPALFLPLEQFTVNLMPTEGTPEFVQAGLTLKVEEQETIDQIKERMPLVRDRILMVLSGKRGADLLPVAGKRKLAEEIATAVQEAIKPPKAKPSKKAKAEEETEEAKADEEAQSEEEGAEAEAKAKAKAKAAAKAAKAAKGPVVEVLFTSFMIQ